MKFYIVITLVFVSASLHSYPEKEFLRSLDGGIIVYSGNGFEKFDSEFQPQWALSFSGAQFWGQNLFILEDSTLLFTGDHYNYRDGAGIVAKIDLQGNILFLRQYYSPPTGTLNTYDFGKALPGDNGFLIGGGCAGTNFVIKCDETGSIEWQYQYSENGGNGFVREIFTSDDRYIMRIGREYSLDLMAIDALGNVIETRHIVTSLNYQKRYWPIQIMKTSNGGYAVLCINDFNMFGNPLIYFLNHDLSLQRTYAVSDTGIGINSLVEISPDVFMALGNKTTLLNESPWVVEEGLFFIFQSNGEVIKRSYLPTTNDYQDVTGFYSAEKIDENIVVYGNSAYRNYMGMFSLINEDLCNSAPLSFYLVSGQSLADSSLSLTRTLFNASGGDTTVNSNTFWSYGWDTICAMPKIATSNTEPSIENIRVYPTYTQSEVVIDIGNTYSIMEYALYDLNGTILKSGEIQPDNLESNKGIVNLDQLPSGFYFIRIAIDGGELKTVKLCKL